MSVIVLTKDNFAETVESSNILFVDFWAEWCAPCRAFAPVFAKASEKYEDITFGKVDTEDQQELAVAFGVRAIPTLVCFRENIMLFNQAGALPPAAFQQLIDQVQKLDMDDVRRQIAEHENEHEHEHGPDCNHDH